MKHKIKGHKLTANSEQKQDPGHAPLHSALPRGRADHLSLPSSWTHWATATLTPFKGLAHPHSGSKQGHLLLVLLPCAVALSLNKALPEFL